LARNSRRGLQAGGVGAARLRRLRRPYFFRKGPPVLRSGTPLEVGQTAGAGGIDGETKAAADHGDQIHNCQDRFPHAQETAKKEELKCPLRIQPRGVPRSAWWPRKGGRQNRRRWATRPRTLWLNTRVRCQACASSIWPAAPANRASAWQHGLVRRVRLLQWIRVRTCSPLPPSEPV